MEVAIVFQVYSLFFLWKSIVSKRTAMERQRRRFQKAQRRIVIMKRCLARQRRILTMAIATQVASFPVERRFWVSFSRYTLVVMIINL